MPQSLIDNLSHPLKGITYSEFDNKEGPQLKYSFPTNIISKETFEVLSDYIIVSKQCSEKLVVVAYDDMQFLNYSIVIENTKYHRNALIFAFGFVLVRGIDIETYGNALRKIASSIFHLETESEFLFQESSKQYMQVILENLFYQLTSNNEAFIDLNTNNNYLAVKLFKSPIEPISDISDYDVPIFRYDSINLSDFPWDITFHHLIPHIDGISHVKQIVQEVCMDSDIVKRSLKILLFYDMIIISDVFKFTNVYKLNTENAMSFFSNSTSMQELSSFATVKSSPHPPSYHQLMNFLLHLQPNKTIKQIILESYTFMQYDLHSDNDVINNNSNTNNNKYAIDLCNMVISKVIAFAKAKNLIRRLYEYPHILTITPQAPSNNSLNYSTLIHKISLEDYNVISNSQQNIETLGYKDAISLSNHSIESTYHNYGTSSNILGNPSSIASSSSSSYRANPMLIQHHHSVVDHQSSNQIVSTTYSPPNNSYTQQRSFNTMPNILRKHSHIDAVTSATNPNTSSTNISSSHHPITHKIRFCSTNSSYSNINTYATDSNNNIKTYSTSSSMYDIPEILKHLNGKEHIDSICCTYGLTYQDIIEYPGVYIVYK